MVVSRCMQVHRGTVEEKAVRCATFLAAHALLGVKGRYSALSTSPAPAASTRCIVSATRPSRLVFVSSYSIVWILHFDSSQIVPFCSLSFCVFFEVRISEPSFTFHRPLRVPSFLFDE
jgi:hypothetical protein